MKNPIIAELRRIRDAHAKRHNYDMNSMAAELMKLEPWMEARTYALQHGKLVPIRSLRRAKRRSTVRRVKGGN